MLTNIILLKNTRSQLSNAVSTNIMRLLDKKLHFFKDKSYFLKKFGFYSNRKNSKSSLKKDENLKHPKIRSRYRTTSVDTALESPDMEVCR